MFEQSQSTGRRGFNPLGGNSKSSLAIDTSVTQHQGRAPQLVYPYESRTQDLSVIDASDHLKNKLPIRPSAQRSTSETAENSDRAIARPGFFRSQTAAVGSSGASLERDASMQPAALHDRIRGLRPSPLDLTHDVSPSDRAITIGIAVPSGAVSDHTASPRLGPQSRQQTNELRTPTIVITPAKEDFGSAYLPEELKAGHHRPASSMYSRYTNCFPRPPEYGRTPPVPPLPLFANPRTIRDSTRTLFEEDGAPVTARETALSVCTDFEDDGESLKPDSAKRLTSQSHLPTPRRSRGWWNVVTSPFSAGPLTGASFWRSPIAADDDEDRRRMLDDTSEMSTVDCHAEAIFTDREPGDEDLRSAVLLDTGSRRPGLPKRSDTAPGALVSGSAAINIYRVPSQGLAAAYYNPNRRFPSIALESQDGEDVRGMEGWSPSQSVAHSGGSPSYPHTAASPDCDDEDGGRVAACERGSPSADRTPSLGNKPQQQETTGKQAASPFLNTREVEPKVPAMAGPRNTFTTPFEDELTGATPARPMPTRNDTAATLESQFSPLTPTPMIEHAHIATYMGPQSSNGELREVQLTPARGRSPPDSDSVPPVPGHGMPIPVQSQAHGQIGDMSEKRPYRPSLHSRTDSSGSRGLGIMDGEKELFPPPKAFVHQPRLGTDRFGQLTVRGVEEEDEKKPSRSCGHRLVWYLISLGSLLLLAMVVSLVMFIPQAHRDMAVEAAWLNLTGFPPLPTGVVTVVQPAAVAEVGQCVTPSSLWSCSVPPTVGSASEPPSFRFGIRFRNGTTPRNETQLSRRSPVTADAGDVVRRDGWLDSLFTPNPAVPSSDDQQFLGQYTDNVSQPYDGEQTPFYLSLLDPSALNAHDSDLNKRQSNPYPYPQLSNATANTTTTSASKRIPRPALRPNGQPADPELYPYATAQPLRLFDRGRSSEHYGFYTYFDRSLLIANLSANATAGVGLGGSVASGVALGNASAVCTWAQTRLRVQIWTRRGTTAASLSTLIPARGLTAANSTADDAAGSLPYPVTVTVDRHGGRAERKGVYCYRLGVDQRVLEGVRTWVDEQRGVGGTLVNPAGVPGSNASTAVKRSDGGASYSGVDGGSGGCACRWQNWE
ncbi:hypothetical protein LTR53_006728 [Teratosphaeriaceae sp. CCFEE 6253]|nr:hypothetical protein LTR53_006728 [Teratosphaeriaceae sp. CCFEE 6253]